MSDRELRPMARNARSYLGAASSLVLGAQLMDLGAASSCEELPTNEEQI